MRKRKRTKVTITKKDIKIGVVSNPWGCALHHGMSRALGGSVGVSPTDYFPKETLGSKGFPLPQSAVDFQHRLFGGKPVKPFSFYVYV